MTVKNNSIFIVMYIFLIKAHIFVSEQFQALIQMSDAISAAAAKTVRKQILK